MAGIICAMVLLVGLVVLVENEVRGVDLPMAPIFLGGDGSASNPYRISNVTELQWMRNASNLGKHFVLVNDIVASATRTWNSGAGFYPIGTGPFNVPGNHFIGSLDGKGYNITDIHINRPHTKEVGFFGYVGAGGAIKDVNFYRLNVTGAESVGGLIGRTSKGIVTNCTAQGNIIGSGDSVGGLIGSNNEGIVTNCTAQGNTTGRWYVGGLVGYNSRGTVIGSSAKGNTTGSGHYVGGLIGGNSDGTVTNCTAQGNTTGSGNSAGGLIGWNSRGTVANCTAQGNTIGNGDAVGGLIGSNSDGTVTECSAKGNTTGLRNSIGGLIGSHYQGTVTDSYTHVAVTRSSGTSSSIGGFIGSNYDGKILRCYSTGNVTYSGVADPTNKGFAGSVAVGASYEMSGNFWDNQTSGQTTSAGGANGKNTDDMHILGTFFNAGWDFNDLWAIKHGYSYPFFRWQYRNDAPIAADDHFTVRENDMLINLPPGILNNDYDPDLDVFPTNLASDVLDLNGYDDVSIKGASVTVNADGSFTYDPTGSTSLTTLADGEYVLDSFKYSIVDSKGLTDNATVFINVTGVNDVPVITTKPVGTATQDVPYSLELTAFDPDNGDVITWTLLAGPAWLELDTYTLGGTPDNDDVGTSWVQVRVADLLGANDTLGFMLTVLNVNDPPVITTDHVITATQDLLYSVLYNAYDPDGDTLTWGLETDADWLSMAGNHLYGIPRNEHLGTYRVNISVTDGNDGWDRSGFMLTVLDVNDPPVITITDVTEAVEGVQYSVNYNALDIDGDDLTWTVDTNATWLDMTADGLLTGLPQVGIFHVNVTVSDGRGGFDHTNFTLITYADSNGNGIPDYRDPELLITIIWNNQTVPEYHNTTVWNNQTVTIYDNTTVNGTGTGSDDVGMNALTIAAFGLMLVVIVVLILIIVVISTKKRKDDLKEE